MCGVPSPVMKVLTFSPGVDQLAKMTDNPYLKAAIAPSEGAKAADKMFNPESPKAAQAPQATQVSNTLTANPNSTDAVTQDPTGLTLKQRQQQQNTGYGTGGPTASGLGLPQV